MKHQFKPWQPVVVRPNGLHTWRAAFFSHYIRCDDGLLTYCCSDGSRYNYCLPADGNEYLVGTTANPQAQPEPKFKFEGPEPKFKCGDKVEVFIYDEWKDGVFLNYEKEKECPYFVLVDYPMQAPIYFKYCRHAAEQQEEKK